MERIKPLRMKLKLVELPDIKSSTELINKVILLGENMLEKSRPGV